MREATTLRDLLTIRQRNEDVLDAIDGPYGTALGLKDGAASILVFVERKIHANWLDPSEYVPARLEADGIGCPTRVFQVGGDLTAPYEPGPLSGARLELRQRLRGADPMIQPGSQISFRSLAGEVANGTLAAFARCRRTRRLGLVTNAHVGEFVGNVLTHPDEGSPVVARIDRMVQQLPAAQRWGGLIDEDGAFVIMDCAFAIIEDQAVLGRIRCEYPWVDGRAIAHAPIGSARKIDLDDPSLWPIGQEVFAVGRSQGDRTGVVRGVAFKSSHGEHTSTYTDLLITAVGGSSDDWFSAPGDSGKLVLTNDAEARPVGLLWGGSMLRTDPSLELIDHSFATDLYEVEEALGVDIGMVLANPS